MERGREGRTRFHEMADPFSNIHGFSSFPSLFGGRDPFDDPFFTRPFGSMFGSDMFGRHPFRSMFDSDRFGPSGAISDTSHPRESRGLIIEELNSDDEKEYEFMEGHEKPKKEGEPKVSSEEPSIKHPDDDDNYDEKKDKIVNHGTSSRRMDETGNHPRTFSSHSCKVTYGGVDGAYYTSTRHGRTGDDGVVIEETKEADRTTGEAAHRISRGIHDKGHSVTRKLNADGKVDVEQRLHNLEEDELAGFEEAWKNDGSRRFSEWDFRGSGHENSSFSGEWKKRAPSESRAFPAIEQPQVTDIWGQNNVARSNSSAGKAKKVVRINID